MPASPTALLIGRFQPPHLGHLALMRWALARHGQLLVLLGSANLARSVQNPFSAPERARLLRAALGGAAAHVRFRPLPDRFDAALWAADVRAAAPAQPVLLGFEKDASSSYLRWFPDWPLELLPDAGQPQLHATDVRAALWRQDWAGIAGRVPASTLAFLQAFAHTPAFRRLVLEDQALRLERAGTAPGHVRHERFGLYTAGGQVALTTRRGPVGAGLWSLPPGPAAGEVLGLFAHPARSLLGPSEAQVFRLTPFPDTQPPDGAHLVRLDTALARPRRFFGDHAVMLERLTRG